MRSDKHHALRRAKAARLLMENQSIVEAFETLEKDATDALIELQAGAEGVEEQHRNVKSLKWLKQRLESYASSIQTLEAEIRATDQFNSGKGGNVRSIPGSL